MVHAKDDAIETNSKSAVKRGGRERERETFVEILDLQAGRPGGSVGNLETF